MNSILTLFLVLMSFLLLGCQTTSAPNYYETKSSLTHGNITLNLKKGVTRQSEVLDIFGAPNVATTDAENREVWTYQKTARITEGSSSSGYATILLAGVDRKSASISQGSRTLTLIITFDSNDVVVDFKSRSTNF
tara:strand:- start:398 stop:802 length:405 start_codon:yes stop_codon:yes gene_type:complete